jgi:acetylornithine deacetylase/succinyl-diaminopimelate desuccinylase-like protein
MPNAVAILARLLTSMHAEDGTVAVEGFYEGVQPPCDEERHAVAEAGFDHRILEMGLTAEGSGDPEFTPGERVGLRPTLELNGIGGGFQGDGIKTVIPSEAHATISCRLVPNQTPEGVFATLRSHIERHRSPTVDIDIVALGGAAPPYRTPPDRHGLRQATAVLTELYGRTPVHTYAGASLPICETFLTELRAHTIFFGFSLDDEQIHAPNEFLRLASFDQAQAAYCLLYQRLGAEP